MAKPKTTENPKRSKTYLIPMALYGEPGESYGPIQDPTHEEKALRKILREYPGLKDGEDYLVTVTVRPDGEPLLNLYNKPLRPTKEK